MKLVNSNFILKFKLFLTVFQKKRFKDVLIYICLKYVGD